ncbi:hypothetical protein [Bradyrhizobium neotropicale]|uniref:Uncharacterized protein n=1 Tax=Bradyrhizobium neotropicale TaxID=1497615 RepID=A0A176Z8B2_9BRAD|nr:hypothetical protein [Bradyrhizobium neotropicale]OAF16939.1 hypothetical protein AXW67_00270 [Bradyrhizobium neotropicale]
MTTVQRAALEAALAASQAAGANAANRIATEHLAKLEAGERPSQELDLDLTTTSWEFIIQDIVRRHRYWSTYRLFLPSLVRACGLMVLEAPSS